MLAAGCPCVPSSTAAAPSKAQFKAQSKRLELTPTGAGPASTTPASSATSAVAAADDGLSAFVCWLLLGLLSKSSLAGQAAARMLRKYEFTAQENKRHTAATPAADAQHAVTPSNAHTVTLATTSPKS
jgi:hypothetical protein